jgi:threonine dehydrogenase-like Zn-dependent dehydrogenase
MALGLLRDGHVDSQQVISHVMPLDKLPEAMRLVRDCRDEVLKVVIKP